MAEEKVRPLDSTEGHEKEGGINSGLPHLFVHTANWNVEAARYLLNHVAWGKCLGGSDAIGEADASVRDRTAR